MDVKASRRAGQLLSFIDTCPTAYHASIEATRRLCEAGFRELDLCGRWELEPEGRYVVCAEGTAVAAFCLPKTVSPADPINIAVAHLDSPGLKLKLDSLREEKTTGTLTASVEVYGGPIVSTWLDRPLNLAGCACFRDGESIVTRPFATKTPVAVIPNAAIHMNREVNKGFDYNGQTHLAPILGTKECVPSDFRALIADAAGMPPESLLTADAFFTPAEPATLAGIAARLLVAPRLDDLAMCEAILVALESTNSPSTTAMAVFLDHEEIGSRTADGADSAFLGRILRSMTAALGGDEIDGAGTCAGSFLVSADMAHAIHPNFKDKHDPAYAPVMNGGPVIKAHAGRKYTTTARTSAHFTAICEHAGVPVQHFIPRSDQSTGSTVGPMVASQLGIAAVDVGNPLWAMHSCIETGGTEDHLLMTAAFAAFFAAENTWVAN